MTVLAIDTSNDCLGIALVDETKIIGEYMTNLKKTILFVQCRQLIIF